MTAPDDASPGTIRSDPRRRSFAQIPEQLLLAELSDRAVRLWGLLDRQAKGREVAIDSRAKLAGKLRCSVDSLDRAIRELIDAGWLSVQHAPGRVSRYTLWDEPVVADCPLISPAGPPTPCDPEEFTRSGSRTGAVTRTGSRSHAATPSAPVRPHTRAIPSLRHEVKEISLSARTPARATAGPAERETTGISSSKDLEPAEALEGEIVDDLDPLTRAALPALRRAAPDITDGEAAGILADVRQQGRIQSIAAWLRSDTALIDIPQRLQARRESAAMWAQLEQSLTPRAEPCFECRNGYLGTDDEDRPIPCHRCRPKTIPWDGCKRPVCSHCQAPADDPVTMPEGWAVR